MADNHSSSAQSDATFEAFSWLNKDARYLPLARLASNTHDIAQGIGLVMEMLEDCQLCNYEDRPRMLDAMQQGILSRLIIAAADNLQSEAKQAIDWLNEHGARDSRSAQIAA